MAGEKKIDVAEPGINTYEEVDKILPNDYSAILAPRERMEALFAIKQFIEKRLCAALNLTMVQVPLIVERESGINDTVDREGSRTPVEFPCGLGLEKRLNAQIVQAATKWKRPALKQFGCGIGEGILTDMRAVRKDYFLDHDHSAYVDQWDWELAVTAEQRTVAFLQDAVRKIWSVIRDAGRFAEQNFPRLKDTPYGAFPDELTFLHAEELLDLYPGMPRKEREAQIVQQFPAVFIIGMGYPLDDGYPHEMRAADYDDWITDTSKETGKATRGLNGDIVVWNPVTRSRLELTSMGIRVTKETLVQQLEVANLIDNLSLPYHQAILRDQLPLSIGGGIGQSRTFMYLLRAAHLGEVSVSVWPKALKEISEKHNIHLLE